MGLEEIYYMSGIVGVVAVVASLIFVGIQIRQSTKVARAQIHQQITDSYISLMMGTANSANPVISGGAFDTMTDDEIEKFSARMIGMFKHYENIFFQNKHGYADDEYWKSHADHLQDMYHRPVLRVWWDIRKHMFADEFVKFVESGRPKASKGSLQTQLRTNIADLNKVHESHKT